MERAIASPEASGPQSFGDQEQIKRGAIIAVFGVALAIFAIITGAWIGVVVALIVTPVRQAIIDRMLPAIKLYIAEGRWR